MADTDLIRRLIWSIGNGTSEASLCETLEVFFHAVCPLANVLNEEICKDYQHAYEARCAPNAHRLAREGTFLYVAIVLLFCIIFASFLKFRKVYFIPESAVTILVGAATGALFVVSNANHGFNEQIFFEILLPFIIFEAGYNMNKRLLNANFGLISGLAIIGTFISFGITTELMVLANDALNTGLSRLDCAMFGALISSTDPIAIVNVFSSLGVNAKLYSIVLGESALNDGVAVALYASMKHFYSEPDIADWDAAKYVLSNFLWISGGSTFVGFVFAAGTALFWKYKGRYWFTHPVMETLAFLICAILPYYIADAFHWSGVIAIMATSLGLSIYAHGNLSTTAQLHVVFFVECIARLCEAVMFGYVGTQIVANNAHMVWTPLVLAAFGIVLVSRAVSIFPILGIHNYCSSRARNHTSERISLSNQVVIWFSGLRGALSFALAITVPEYDTVLKRGSKHSGELLACTCFIIVMNVFLLGGLAPFVVSALVKSNNATSLETGSSGELTDTTSNSNGVIGRLHSNCLVPCLTLQSENELRKVQLDLSRVLRSPLLGDNQQNEGTGPIPDEQGFIHIAFDDNVDEHAKMHTLLFPRSRLAMPFDRRISLTSQTRSVSNDALFETGQGEQ